MAGGAWDRLVDAGQECIKHRANDGGKPPLPALEPDPARVNDQPRLSGVGGCHVPDQQAELLLGGAGLSLGCRRLLFGVLLCLLGRLLLLGRALRRC